MIAEFIKMRLEVDQSLEAARQVATEIGHVANVLGCTVVFEYRGRDVEHREDDERAHYLADRLVALHAEPPAGSPAEKPAGYYLFRGRFWQTWRLIQIKDGRLVGGFLDHQDWSIANDGKGHWEGPLAQGDPRANMAMADRFWRLPPETIDPNDIWPAPRLPK